MNKNILTPDYERTFEDVNYPAPIPILLKGLAAAIQDSHTEWRPKISELVALLPESKKSNRLVLAGSAYGAAKVIQNDFPGPAILLFGAALNAIGSAPQIELEKAIVIAEKKIKDLSIDDDNVKLVFTAAKERANFAKVSELLRQEFTNGLKNTGKYTDVQIAEVVPKIVNITHDVRHKGLIEKFYWWSVDSDFSLMEKNISISKSSTDISFLHQENRIIFADSELRKLIPYAQEGCAYAILRELKTR